MVGERCVDVLLIFGWFSLVKIGHFSHGNENLRVKEAAQLDEIRFACRGILLLDPIEIWSHSVQRSGLGDRKKYGPLVIFRRK